MRELRRALGPYRKFKIIRIEEGSIDLVVHVSGFDSNMARFQLLMMKKLGQLSRFNWLKDLTFGNYLTLIIYV